jgi:glycosyltransferase involved in cell wall biosynthesis
VTGGRGRRVLLTHVYGWPEVRRGAERYLHELGAGLRRAGHEPRIVVTAPTPAGDEALGVPVRLLKRRLGLSKRYGEFADQVAFGMQTFPVGALGRFEVWHAMSSGDSAAAALAGQLRPGLRSVVTEMGVPYRDYRMSRSDHRWFSYAVRHADEFVCLSEPAADALADGFGRRAHVVGAGVDLNAFRPAPQRADRPTLLFPGSLSEPRKNAGLFLEAVGLLRRAGVDVDVWLVGPGELPPLSELARAGLEAASIHATARTEDLPDLYARAWVTALPSYSEVFGLVVLESLASGTPAVVLDDGLGPSLLVDDGTGRRSEPGADALAESLRGAIELAREPGTPERCRARAAEFDWDRVIVPRLLEIYDG